MADGPNILVICNDEHHPRMTGYRHHPWVKTPNLDRLAARGTAFHRAYCNSPICTPSRMSFITGKYVHQIDSWTIGFPLDRSEPTWARRLDDAGIPCAMFGKMDFCGDYQDGGFSTHRVIRRRQAWPVIPPLVPWEARLKGYTRQDKRRVVNNSCVRSDQLLSDGGFIGERVDAIGNYDHDRLVTNWSVEHLRGLGSHPRQGPWGMYVGLLMPHWPFCVPPEYYEMYHPDRLDLPVDAHFPNAGLHPALRHFQAAQDLGEVTEPMLRQIVAAYYGMITCVDAMVGEILDELRRQGMEDDTVVIFTSDHGESLGEHGLFFKQCAYEGSVGVPLLMAGPGVPEGRVIDTPVSLVDMYPTILDAVGLEPETDRPGQSWLPLARGEQPNRRDYAFAEFHANFFRHTWYMLAQGPYKYTHYVNERPTLFDVDADPHELVDLASDPAHAVTVADFDRLLRSLLDPEATATRAKAALGLIGPNCEDYTETRCVEP